MERITKEELEAISSKVHESWMRQRQAEGWTYGETYDREQKKTPFMIPYEELPESEKEVDRATVRQTLAAAEALGYQLVKKG